MAIIDRLAKMFNAFRLNDDTFIQQPRYSGMSTSVRPHIPRTRYSNERTIITSILTRMAVDFSGIDIKHVKLDDKKRYISDIEGSLNRCFTLQPNIDQGPRAFRQDIAMTLFDDGVAVIVPVRYSTNKETGDFVEIKSLRVGKVVQWHPSHVRVLLYNEEIGRAEEITVLKSRTAIVENPFYAVMNETNSTLQRLVRKLSLLDVVDEQASSGKLDIIIQLPYTLRSETKRAQAEQRREDIEFQLKDSKYGIAYAEATEKIVQLNRPAENNLLKTIEFLVSELYAQLGITKGVMDGTADEATMVNYMNRTIMPINVAAVEAMRRTFVGENGVDRDEEIRNFRNPFELVPMKDMAEIADKFTRNEIFSSNEIRNFMGAVPSDDPKADQLVNSNMPQPNPIVASPPIAEMDAVINEVFDGITSDIDGLVKGLDDG